MTSYLPLAFVVLASLGLICAALAVIRMDRSWLPRLWSCCRCAHSWPGYSTRCPRCYGPGTTQTGPPHRLPTHDWQGNLPTGPIPVVSKAGVR